MPADSQKLIAYGKVLDKEEKTLADWKIKDGDFLVVMVQKVSHRAKTSQSRYKKCESPLLP